MIRASRRNLDELRPLKFQRRYTRQAPGSVLVRMGRTTVLCTCCVERAVPPFLVGKGKGWLTAEYGMLPGSTNTRKQRDRGGKVDGRTVEIQRLIGRSLRAVVNLEKLGERTLWLDCDVLEADGGTRTASINGAFVALVDALAAHKRVFGPPAQIVTMQRGRRQRRLAQRRRTARSRLQRRQGRRSGPEPGHDRRRRVHRGAGHRRGSHLQPRQLDRLLKLGKLGIDAITQVQRQALGVELASGLGPDLLL